MARRGFLAELNHQVQLAAREQQRNQRAQVLEHSAALRRAEQAQRAEERARAQLARAAEAERKRLEKEAREAHIAVMEAEVDERNLRLAEVYEEIDSLLSATLGVDNFVDLETLRVVAKHPPFGRPELERPIPAPGHILDPAPPILAKPDAPKGLAKLFGRRRHAAAVARAKEANDRAMSEWRKEGQEAPARRKAAEEAHKRAEAERLSALESERARYAQECAAREAEATEHNSELDQLIGNLGYGVPAAVDEYVAIVLANSVCPAHFPVTHEFEFDPVTLGQVMFM